MWVSRPFRDKVFVIVLLIVFGFLSIGTVVAARRAETAAKNTRDLIERADRNSPILDFIKDCTTPGGSCYERNKAVTAQAIAIIVAQEACVVKESLGYKLPDRTPAEIEEIKKICRTMLNGDALDLLRRINPTPAGG